MYINESTKKWESSQDDSVKKERELIVKVQQYNDSFSMNQLVKLFRGTLTNIARESSSSGVFDYDTAYSYCVNFFKDIIKNNFDLNQQVKPITYITNAVKNKMNNLRYDLRDTSSKKSQDLSRKAEQMAVAKSWLKGNLDRDPTHKEIYDFIKDTMGKGGEGLRVENISRIESMNKKEYSGSQQIGGDSGGEFLRLSDVKDSNADINSIYNKMMAEQKILDIINSNSLFSKEEKRIIRNVFGLEEFKGNKAKNLVEAALNNNTTRYGVHRIIEKLDREMKRNG